MYQEPPISDALNPIIAKLGQSIRKMLNPLEDYQTGVLNAISKDPDLMQKFANLEYTNPGVLQRMGFGNVGNIIGSAGPDLRTQYEQQYGPAIVAGEGAKAQNVATTQQGIGQLLKIPTVATDIERKAAGIGTVSEQREQEARTTIAESGAKVAPLKAETEEAQLNILKDTLKKYPEFQNVNPWDLVTHPASNPKALYTLMAAHPQVMEQLFTSARNEEDLSNRWAMFTQRMSNKDLMRDLIQRRAVQSYADSNFTGSIDQWVKFYSDPKVTEKASLLATGKLPIQTEDDRLLSEIGKQAQLQSNIKYSKVQDDVYKFITTQINTVRSAKSPLSLNDLSVRAAAINDKLKDLSATGGPQIEARVVPTRWYQKGKGNIKFYNKSTKEEVDPDNLEAILTQPIGFNAKMQEVSDNLLLKDYSTDMETQSTISAINNPKNGGTEQQRFDLYKRQRSPDEAQLVYIREEFRKKGVILK